MAVIKILLEQGPPKTKSEAKQVPLLEKVEDYIGYCKDCGDTEAVEYEYLEKLLAKLKKAKKLPPELSKIKSKLEAFFKDSE